MAAFEQYRYGSGKLTGADAGAPGRMVRVVAHRGPLTTSRVRQVTRHSYLSSGQLGASQVVSYQLVKRERLVRRKRGRGFIRRKTTQNEKTSVQQERMHLDILGRRLGVSQSFQDVRRGLGVRRSATSLSYELDAQDPIVELSTSPSEPDLRRVVRSAATGRILGEMRNTGTRYAVHDHLGSVRAMLDAENQPTIQATSDFDTWGATRITRAASGTAVERQHMAYGYTGMRTNTTTATTHHHARDYDPNAKTWLQTDQYMDPWLDVGLSLGASTRDRYSYAGGNPVGFVDTNGHAKTTSDGESIRPAKGCRANDYKCDGGGVVIRERADTASGCGCTMSYPGSAGGAAAISYGGQTVRATRSTVRVLRQELVSQRAALAQRIDGLQSYLTDANAACDGRLDRWIGATCQAYQQGATNALHQLDGLSGQTVGFEVKPRPLGSWFATTGAELLGGASISLGRGLLHETTTDPIYAVGKTVYGAKLIAKGTVLSGAGIAVGTYQDGTHGLARSSISFAVSAGATAAAGSAGACGRFPHRVGAGVCSLGVGVVSGVAAGYGYDEVRKAAG